MQHIEIFGFPPSTFTRTARLVCEEKRVDYQLQPLEFRQESHRALHPFVKMPVMRVSGQTLYETLAIAMYIDETFEGPQLTPSDALKRAQMFQWISTCNDYLYKDVVLAFLNNDSPSEEQLEKARKDLEIIDRQLQAGPFLLGEEIYLCDLFLAPVIAFVDGGAHQARLLGSLEGIAAWKDKMWSRASFKNTQP